MDMRQTANKKKYNLAASIYDYIAYVISLGQAGKIYTEVAGLIEKTHSAVIVELGCGPGSVTPYILNIVSGSCYVVGIDFSEKMIDLANKKKITCKWNNADFECMDLYDIPKEKNVDVAIFCLALTAIPDPKKALAKAVSLLKPGGQLIIADSFPLSSRWWHPVTNAYITLKSLLVGASPSREVIPHIHELMTDVHTKHLLGGIYTFVSARKPS